MKLQLAGDLNNSGTTEIHPASSADSSALPLDISSSYSSWLLKRKKIKKKKKKDAVCVW